MDVFEQYEPGWRRKRSSLERILVALVCILFIVIVILIILLGVLTSNRQPSDLNKVSDVCLTEACINAASDVLKAMDKSIDPCEDFYSYACGGWINDRPLLPGDSEHSVSSKIPTKNDIYLMKALEYSDDDVSTLSNAEIKAKTFYASCVDVNHTVDELGSQPLLHLINEVGGWVLLMNDSDANTWDWNSWNFLETLFKIHKISEEAPLFRVEVSKTVFNTEHPKRNVLEVSPSGLTLSNPEYYKESKLNSARNKRLSTAAKRMTDLILLLGAQDNDTTFNAIMKVLEFEEKLANITQSFEPDNFGKGTVPELQQSLPFINWRQYLQGLLQDTSYQVKDNEAVTLTDMEYFSGVSVLLQLMLNSSDGLTILHNYLMWHLAKSYLPHLSKTFSDTLQEIHQIMHGTVVKEDALICAQKTDKMLPLATGAMFVRGKFSEESKKSASSMSSYTLEAFKQSVTSLPWIDQETSKAVIEKADSCGEIIGYPEFIKNISYMNDIYSEIPINENTYFENVVSIVKFRLRENLLLLGTDTPSDPITTGVDSLTEVNAAYFPNYNKLIIPAGFIQPPYFDNNYLKSINFGSLGMVFGHELVHGFDDSGRKHDKNGILSSWWSQKSVENFEKLTQCFVDQYSNYSVYGRNVDGNKTLGENISDNGGLKTSFYAYLNWVRDHQPEPMLPSINLTHEQLFFVAFAQAWCNHPSESYIESQILTDEHSPDRIRVIGSVSNSKEFSQHFKCKPGQPMNPSKKCEIW